MEEEKAHRLYMLFKDVDQGARYKQGLGFSSGNAGFAKPTTTSDGSYIENTFVKAGSAKPSSLAIKQKRDLQEDGSPDQEPPRRGRERERSRERGASGPSDHFDNWHASGERYGAWDSSRSSHDHPSRLDQQRERGSSKPDQRSDWARGHERSQRSDQGHDQQQGREHGGRASSSSSGKASKPRGLTEADMAEQIPGYRHMNPAEKLKARTRLMLQQADKASAVREATREDDEGADGRQGGGSSSAAVGSGSGSGSKHTTGGGDELRGWGRFVTTKSEAFESEWELRNKGNEGLGTSYNGMDLDPELAKEMPKQPKPIDKAQKKREQQHEDAIFGRAPCAESPRKAVHDAHAHKVGSRGGGGSRAEAGREKAKASSHQQPMLSTQSQQDRDRAGKFKDKLQQPQHSLVHHRLPVDQDDEDAPVVVTEEELLPQGREAPGDAELGGTLASEVMARQQQMSWRERALLARGKRAG